MASQLLGIKTRFTNDLGSPLVGGQVYTYFAGTSTNQDSYSDSGLTVPNTNPVILDDTGSADIFLKGAYRIRVFDKSGRFIEEQDNVTQAASQGDATELNNKITTLESGLSTANTEISAANTEISKVKLDTGITATAKFGGVARTQAEKNADYISIKDFGLVADGVVDDSLKLQTIESAYTNRQIDMLGKTVLINALPSNNTYYNGWFKVGNTSYRSNIPSDLEITNNSVAIGANTPKLPLDTKKWVVAIGYGSMSKNVGGLGSSEAIGVRSLYNATTGVYNIALGFESQYELIDGTRNTAIGGNSLRFNLHGSNNVAIGRNTGQGITQDIGDTETGVRNTAVGVLAMSGFGSLKYRNTDDIINQTPIYSNDCVAVGTSALFYGGDNGCIAIGTEALMAAKYRSKSNIAIGFNAMRLMGDNTGWRGGSLKYLTVSGSYSMTENSAVFTFTKPADVTISVGDWLVLRIDSGIPIYQSTAYRDIQHYKVKSISGNSYTVDEPNGVIASGSFTLEAIENTGVLPPEAHQNIAIGTGCMHSSKKGKHNVGVGANNLKVSNGNANTAIGDYALENSSDANAHFNTGIGYAALRHMVDGSPNTNTNRSTGIGFEAKVSGSNQLQLGDSATTTHAFGAVQDRSDARDKIIEGDITDAHINFFNDVEFKRYRLDYRDDYIVRNDDGTVTKLDKDGSKARKREHVGVIAQQVEQAMKAHNVDFAGLQHHAVNGGNDVYTVGYQEFIPILGEIVQRQQKQIDELMALIKK